jgi:hypothetical protein
VCVPATLSDRIDALTPIPAPESATQNLADAAQDAEDIERELRANLPAIYVDTWATVTWKGHVRIVLGERLYKMDMYRSAFVMELSEAESFATHLLRVIQRRREREKEARKDQDQESDA